MVKTPIKLTYEEYLTYDDGTDNRYELVEGKLLMTPLPSADHSDVIDLLRDVFREQITRSGQPWIVKTDVGVYIGKNPNTGSETSLTPNICVVTREAWAILKANKQSKAILSTFPLLVVEVVSRSSRKTDYQNKLTEYAKVGIPEYWIVDLREHQVCVGLLVEGNYRVTEFRDSTNIVSGTFPELKILARQIIEV